MSIEIDPQPCPIDHLVEQGSDAAAALMLQDRILTFADLRSRVGKLAAWLSSELPTKGSRVASWAAKGELTCLLPIAAARANLVYVPINPALRRAQVEHILADSGAEIIIGNSTRLLALGDGLKAGTYRGISEQDVLDIIDNYQNRLEPSIAHTDDLVSILYTSGSTGKPKGVMLSHANIWLGAVSVAHYLELSSDDVTMALLPFSFDYGQNQLFSTWFAGGAVVPFNYLLPKDVPKNCEKFKVTTIAAVPPLWIQIVGTDWAPNAVKSLRRLTNSGGSLNPDLVERLRSIFPEAKLFPMYGLTEAFRSTYLDPELVAKYPTSIGSAIPFAEVLILDEEGNPVKQGQEGELVHCGPLVAKGYWQDKETTKKRFRPAPAFSKYPGTAVWSGDRVKQGENGLLYFVGREDNLIKSQGNRISPQEIEDAALETNLVSEAAAFGIYDDVIGQAIHLAVTKTSGVQDAKELLPKLLATKLPKFMQPGKIHWYEELPLNSNGKIDYPALKRGVDQ